MKKFFTVILFSLTVAVFAGGVAVVDSNWLLRSSACRKALWEKWDGEFKAAEGVDQCEVTRLTAVKEYGLKVALRERLGVYLSAAGYDRIVDLAVDKEAAKEFKAEPTLAYELLGKIDSEWFPVTWFDTDSEKK